MDNNKPSADITIRSGWFLIALVLCTAVYIIGIGFNSLSEAEDDNFTTWAFFLIGAAFFCTALVMKAITTKVFIAEQVIIWSQRGLLSKPNEKIVKFSDVQSIDIETMSGSRKITQRIVLKGEEFTLPLSQAYTSNRPKLDSLRNKLLETLTLEPPVDDFDTELKQLIKTGDKITAIKYVRERKGWSLIQAKSFIDKKMNDI